MKEVISFGAGVNSVAMTILLYKQDKVIPLIFTDTCCECPHTYEYIKYFEKEFLSKYKQKIIWLSPLTTPEYYPKFIRNKTLEDYILEIKFFPSIKKKFCTKHYKLIPFKNFAKRNNVSIYYVGFSLEEINRAKRSKKVIESMKTIYPLIENKLTRIQCYEIIQKEGLKLPKKSSCYFCPFQNIYQWQILYQEYPELFQRAKQLEKCINKNRKSYENSYITLLPNKMTLEQLEKKFQNSQNLSFDFFK